MAQAVEEPVVLAISLENVVLYCGNVSDVTKEGKESGPVNTSEQILFVSGINVGDIVAINGRRMTRASCISTSSRPTSS
jgi:hypothetical protein